MIVFLNDIGKVSLILEILLLQILPIIVEFPYLMAKAIFSLLRLTSSDLMNIYPFLSNIIMSTNPLFHPSNSPTKTTRPTKAVNEAPTHVRLTHNTFDNSYFNFKTQRYGKYEPFWWKVCTAGDNEPYSNSHNVRSLPFASPVLSPMKLNKDYFQVPMYAIQPNAWDYIFKNPNQGDDVPLDAQNLLPLYSGDTSIFELFNWSLSYIAYNSGQYDRSILSSAILVFVMYENFLSSGSLLYSLGYKINPVFLDTSQTEPIYMSYDQVFDKYFTGNHYKVIFEFDDPDSPTGFRRVTFSTGPDSQIYTSDYHVDSFTFVSLLRSHFGQIVEFVADEENSYDSFECQLGFLDVRPSDDDSVNYLRMDVVNAYQLACAQYYVNPRVDFLYNAQLYRDNFVQLIRELFTLSSSGTLNIESFDYNGIPVLYDYFSSKYYSHITDVMSFYPDDTTVNLASILALGKVLYYLFGYQDQLRFGDYLADSRTQALGYGEPGSDSVQVYDDSISVTDMSQKLVLQRFRGAVAHLDNTAEDYLETMFHEQLPPDYHYPKFIVHSEFGIAGDEISNTTSDNQGNIVTNLKSGDDTAEFNIDVSVNSILIGISYISVPAVYSQIKERSYFHRDRYDMFQPMLQYFGDQGIYNREVSDFIPNPSDAYGYTSRNGEYKQRMSQCSGAFLTTLRSWIFTLDLPLFAGESSMPRLAHTQSPLAIRTFDFEFNRFLGRQTGVSLGTGFHFIMQYNNKNVDNRPMDVNPLPLYPSNSL